MATTIAVMIGTPTGTCLLAAATERDAAVMTERALLALSTGALPAPVWVQCADDGVQRRLGRYFADLQNELAAVPTSHEPVPDPE